MIIRPISDIHLNVKSNYGYVPVENDGDPDTTLIIAGDIGTPYLFRKWVSKFNGRFRNTIAILGNHDYYGMSIERAPYKWKESVRGLDNVHILHNSYMDVDGVRIIGGTLWTHLGALSHSELQALSRLRNEYKKVRAGAGYSRLTPAAVHAEFMTTWGFIKDSVNSALGMNTVVVVHHSPFKESSYMYNRFESDECAPAYSSDMSHEIRGMTRRPNVVIHGHLHHHVDYDIDGMRVICNPRGHMRPDNHNNPNEYFEETGFIDGLTFEIPCITHSLEA